MNKIEREAAAMTTHRVASGINERIEHDAIYVSYTEARNRENMTAAQRDYEATHITIAVNVTLPASAPDRIEALALDLQAVLVKHGIKAVR